MDTQESIDEFYWRTGPCCAGCDYWRHFNSLIGECIKSAPVSGQERVGVLGMQNVSAHIPAGHIMTRRDHYCGAFRDLFDWASLPLAYLSRIGAPTPPR
jgi:hypothetical protein